MTQTELEYADILWQEDGTPLSTNFDDVYFSKIDGPAETEYVFLQANKLPQRFQDAQTFTIAETGFGTGLNFLSVCKLWLDIAPDNSKLRFISAEKTPLRLEDIQKAHDMWPEFKFISERLLSIYPDLVPGWHTLKFEPEGITLRLFLGDVMDAFNDCEEQVDAWFLDGFAPSKNPDMWQGKLLKKIACLTASGGTYSTFTAASNVRKSLENNGFLVNKTKGFANKRDMIHGEKI